MKNAHLLLIGLAASFNYGHATTPDVLKCEKSEYSVMRLIAESDIDTRLKNVEQAMEEPSSLCRDFILLPYAARDAYRTGDVEKAKKYADSLLGIARTLEDELMQGDALNAAYGVLGLVALSKENYSLALEYLSKSAKIPQSPTLARFGPNMLLPRELLNAGFDKEVIRYLEEIRSVYISGVDRIDTWITYIERGWDPDFFVAR